MAYSLPKPKLVKPSTLNGQVNGRLNPSLMEPIGVGTAIMERTAARAFRAMFARARTELGVVIKEVGDYRDFFGQLNLFLDRYEPISYADYLATPSDRRKYWPKAIAMGYKSLYWRKKRRADGTYPATAAVPEFSNHGWALALDIAEEYDSDPAADPISSRFVQWLIANAVHFGIGAELDSEPWHWRYIAGDNIPSAVLAFEAGNPAPPNPTPVPGGISVVTVTTVILKKGSTGSEVKRIQSILNEVSGRGLTVDGNFGALTEQAVKDWQAWFKVPGGADGIVGAATMESFLEVWLATAK